MRRIRFFQIGLFALGFSNVAATTVKVCGSVLLPPSVALTTGDIQVTMTLDKFTSSGTTTTTASASVDGTARTYCVQLDNSRDPAPLDIWHTARIRIQKTSSPVQEIHSALLQLSNTEGNGTPYFSHAADYNAILDVFYLGASDPMSVKLFFPGLKSFATDAVAKANISTPSNDALASKIVTRIYPKGSLVSNGSFENGYANWQELTIPFAAQSAAKAYSGSSLAAMAMPNVSSYALVSEPFVVTANTQYTLSFYYRAYQVTGDVRAIIRGFTDKASIESGQETFSTRTDAAYSNKSAWTSMVKNLTTAPNTRYVTITLLGHSPSASGGGILLFDDVVFEPGSTASQSLINPNLQYFDGFQRPIQSVQSNGAEDIITATEFDNFGRPAYAALPVGYDYLRHSGRHTYLEGVISGATGGHLGFYYGDASVPSPKTLGYAYSEFLYENSPLGRLKQTWQPGGAWRTAARSRQNTYAGTDGIAPTGGTDQAPAPNAAPQFSYELNQSEESRLTRTFKDRLGRVVKSGAKSGASWIDSRWEYDGNGRIVKAISPNGPAGVPIASTSEYNSLGNKLSFSSPDEGKTLYIYDLSNRLRLTQTAAQRDLSPPRFNYIKYDAYDRVIETGEFRDASYFLPDVANDPQFPVATSEFRIPRTLNFYDRQPMKKNFCPDAPGSLTYIIRSDPDPSNPFEFSSFEEAYDEAYAEISSLSSFSGQITFYQVFNSPSTIITPTPGRVFTPFKLLGNPNPTIPFKLYGVLRSSEAYQLLVGQPYVFPTGTWGPMKGRLMQTVVCNSDLSAEGPNANPVITTYNYDKYGNATDIFEYNGYIQDPARRTQSTYQKFDVQNRLVEKYLPSAGTGSVSVRYSYLYNGLGKLDQVLDNSGAVVAKYSYNALGQLSALTVGQGSGRVDFTYGYHFRGMMNKIQANSGTGTRLFLQELKFEDGSVPLYDGKIAEYNYALTTAAIDKFSFTYDPLGRLASAFSTVKAPNQTGNSDWQFTYFDNGTFKAMTRMGQVFTYEYWTLSDGTATIPTNRVRSVTFTGFYPRNTTWPSNFKYDASGRLTSDDSKFMGIFPSSAGIPYKFEYTKDGIQYTQYMIYDAGGRRTSKLLYKDRTEFISATHYLGSGKEIREAAVQPVTEIYPLGEVGRVLLNSSGQPEMEAYIKNHLGSTVKVYNVSTNAESYRTDYEPFGRLRLQTSASNYVGLTPKYTGKEFDDGIDLDYFGARYYDDELGFWISPDPARQFDSPYSYAGNGFNPINGIDRDGRTLGSNLRFLWQWAIGSGETNREYDEQDIETKELAASTPIKQLREKFYENGAKSIVKHEYKSWDAYRETAWKITETEAQVGGFGNGTSLINNGNGTMTFTVKNDAGTHSFWFHAVDDRACESCSMRTIHQTFKWTEPIVMPGKNP